MPAISNEHAQRLYGEAGAWLKLLYNPLVTKDFIKVQGGGDTPNWMSFRAGLLDSAGKQGLKEEALLPLGFRAGRESPFTPK